MRRRRRPGGVNSIRTASGEVRRSEESLVHEIERRAAKAGVVGGRGVRLGIGHDCAVIGVGSGEEVAWHVDDQVEGVHFRRRWATLEDVGWKAAGAALSDLAAAGARPLGVQLALELPEEIADEEVLELVDGFVAALAASRTPLVGGNVTGRPRGSGLSLSVSVAGAVARGTAFRRDGARPGDGLYVSGEPGLAGVGLLLLEGGGPRAGAAGKEAIQRFLRPTPRIGVGLSLQRLGPGSRPRAVTDTSDGLLRDSRKLAKASGLEATLFEMSLGGERLVRSLKAAQLLEPRGGGRAMRPVARTGSSVDVLRIALEGGEDYELLLAAPRRFESTGVAKRTFRRVGTLGRGIAGMVRLERADGSLETLEGSGFDHRR